ncbi:hypothetical protein I4U23_019725 [Adineta vaga]|nr:hypothetical protein I4U23_019725 [Adineta vaga]
MLTVIASAVTVISIYALENTVTVVQADISVAMLRMIIGNEYNQFFNFVKVIISSFTERPRLIDHIDNETNSIEGQPSLVIVNGSIYFMMNHTKEQIRQAMEEYTQNIVLLTRDGLPSSGNGVISQASSAFTGTFPCKYTVGGVKNLNSLDLSDDSAISPPELFTLLPINSTSTSLPSITNTLENSTVMTNYTTESNPTPLITNTTLLILNQTDPTPLITNTTLLILNQTDPTPLITNTTLLILNQTDPTPLITNTTLLILNQTDPTPLITNTTLLILNQTDTTLRSTETDSTSNVTPTDTTLRSTETDSTPDVTSTDTTPRSTETDSTPDVTPTDTTPDVTPTDTTPRSTETDSTLDVTQTYSNLNDTTVTLITELTNPSCSFISQSSFQLQLKRAMQTLELPLFYNITSTFQELSTSLTKHIITNFSSKFLKIVITDITGIPLLSHNNQSSYINITGQIYSANNYFETGLYNLLRSYESMITFKNTTGQPSAYIGKTNSVTVSLKSKVTLEEETSHFYMCYPLSSLSLYYNNPDNFTTVCQPFFKMSTSIGMRFHMYHSSSVRYNNQTYAFEHLIASLTEHMIINLPGTFVYFHVGNILDASVSFTLSEGSHLTEFSITISGAYYFLLEHTKEEIRAILNKYATSLDFQSATGDIFSVASSFSNGDLSISSEGFSQVSLRENTLFTCQRVVQYSS